MDSGRVWDWFKAGWFRMVIFRPCDGEKSQGRAREVWGCKKLARCWTLVVGVLEDVGGERTQALAEELADGIAGPARGLRAAVSSEQIGSFRSG